MDVKEIIRKYHDTCRRYQLSDEYLQEQKCKTRIEMPQAAEFCYGVVYLQDSAVDMLIRRIDGLEMESQMLRGIIESMDMDEWGHRGR